MDKTQEMIDLFRLLIKKDTPIQTTWATAGEISEDGLHMDCTEVISDLTMFDVHLGLGAVVIHPKKGAKCLLGIIENNEANAFLIFAEEAEKVIVNSENVNIKSDKVTFNDGMYSMVKAEELRAQLDKNNIILNAILTAFQAFTPPPAPDAGAVAYTFLGAVKTALAPLTTGVFTGIGNKKIKH